MLGALLAAPGAALAQVDIDAPPAGEASPGETGEAGRDPLITMFDNFAISGVVSRLCKPVDEGLMDKFLANFSAVQTLLIRRMRSEMPDKPSKEIGDMLLGRMENLNTVATNVVQSKGCTSPEVAQLLDLFTVNASMDLAKRK